MGAKAEGQSQVIVFTGAGKGKTTAALGLACRAVGHGGKAAFIHFTGPERPTLGEVTATRSLGAELKMIGIECQAEDPSYLSDFDQSVPTLEAALDLARQLIKGGEYDVVVLDDINPLLHQGRVDEEAVIELISDKPENTTVVLTGRFALDSVVEMADVVTHFAEVKHPVRTGLAPRKGIDF